MGREFDDVVLKDSTRKERFAEVSKKIKLDTNLKIISLNYQNNYVETDC